nr:hypothetical protein [Tanacetum cinerariifolium]
MTKKQKREYYMAVIKSNLGWRFKDFKGMTFEDIEVKFAEVWKQVEDFIPMDSKEETERLKRKGLNLEKEQVHSEGQRSYWQIIRLGGSSACYQFFVDLLRQLDMEDLNQLWALVKEYLSIRPASNDKDMELWVELKRIKRNIRMSSGTATTNLFNMMVIERESFIIQKRYIRMSSASDPPSLGYSILEEVDE